MSSHSLPTHFLTTHTQADPPASDDPARKAPPACRLPASRFAAAAAAVRPGQPPPPPATLPPGVSVSLHVRWHGAPPAHAAPHLLLTAPKPRSHALLLRPIAGVTALHGVSRRLLDRAYTPEAAPTTASSAPSTSAPPAPAPAYPPHLTASAAHYHFTPTPEFLSLPGDVSRTEFRLVLACGGWEYVILRRDMHEGGGGGGSGSAAAVEVEEEGGEGEGGGGKAGPPPPSAPPARHKLLVTAVEFESAAVMAGTLGVRLALVAYPVVTVSRSFLDAAVRAARAGGLRGLLVSQE